MYFLGHIALGYFSAEAVSRITKKKYNLLVVWFFSVAPDLDILIPNLVHRGPTHSLAAILLILIPSVILYRDWMPYAASFGSHALIGDLFTGTVSFGGCMLLWPLSLDWQNLGVYLITGSLLEFLIEIALFGLMIICIREQLRKLLRKKT